VNEIKWTKTVTCQKVFIPKTTFSKTEQRMYCFYNGVCDCFLFFSLKRLVKNIRFYEVLIEIKYLPIREMLSKILNTIRFFK